MQSEFCFQAGEMTVKDKKVHANPDRGALRFYINNETSLLSMKWENIDKKTSSEEIIITAGDWVFKKVSTKKGSPFFIQSSAYPEEKYFYYFQINKKEDIEKIEKKIIDILSKGQLTKEEENKESQSVPMSVEELATNKDNKPANSIPATGAPQPTSNFLKNFSEILRQVQKKYPSLGKILTTEKVTKLFDSLDEETQKKLIELLPEHQRTKQGFYDNINSPQFKQGLGSLSYAVNSENLPAIISSFGLDINVAQKYGNGVEAFVKSIVAKYTPKEDKKEKEDKEDKKESK